MFENQEICSKKRKGRRACETPIPYYPRANRSETLDQTP